MTPNHTFHNEENYLNTVSVGLRYLVQSLNFGPLAEDIQLYKALESYNRRMAFSDNLLEVIASQRANGLNSQAFEDFCAQLQHINDAA